MVRAKCGAGDSYSGGLGKRRNRLAKSPRMKWAICNGRITGGTDSVVYCFIGVFFRGFRQGAIEIFRKFIALVYCISEFNKCKQMQEDSFQIYSVKGVGGYSNCEIV